MNNNFILVISKAITILFMGLIVGVCLGVGIPLLSQVKMVLVVIGAVLIGVGINLAIGVVLWLIGAKQ